MWSKSKIHLVFYCFLLLTGEVDGQKYYRDSVEALLGYDSFLITQCHAIFYNDRNVIQAIMRCMTDSRITKPGTCPKSFEDLPVFVQACEDFCYFDRDCPLSEKCCAHSCGRTCKPAKGLLENKNLPPIPENVTAVERDNKKCIDLIWDMPPFNEEDL